MSNGGIARRMVAGFIVVSALGALSACKSDSTTDDVAGAPASSAPVVKYFGPDGYGQVTLALGEKDALATGELQTAPVATVLGKHVYSFVGGPKPDPKRMAADAKIEKADQGSDKSAQGYANDAKAYADSAQRIADRLVAYLTAGGAEFVKGKVDSIAAPKGATTAEGIKRGSTVAELTAAYGSQGLKKSSKATYELPVPGHAGWSYLFEVDGGPTVLYMSLVHSR